MPSSETFKNLASGMAAIAVPIAVAVLGSYYTSAAKEREVSAKFVELAVGILAKPPGDTDQGIRNWATEVLDRYSGVEFDAATRAAIINRVALPTIVDTPVEGGSRTPATARRISRIIVRDTQQTDLQTELAGLRLGRVSYHYLVDRSGTVHRLKPEGDIAYHSAGANADSIGIGLSHVSGQGGYTSAQIAALTGLLREIGVRRGLARGRVFSATDIDPRRRSDFAADVKASVLDDAFAPAS